MTKRSDYNELLISNNAKNENGSGNVPSYQMQDLKSVKSVKALGSFK